MNVYTATKVRVLKAGDFTGDELGDIVTHMVDDVVADMDRHSLDTFCIVRNFHVDHTMTHTETHTGLHLLISAVGTATMEPR